MYKYYLSLGSNLGMTVKNIDRAIDKIGKLQNVKVVRIAPYYFNPPLLPPDGDESYYHVFCNTCIEMETSINPHELLDSIKQIEVDIGRGAEHSFWSPRTIDIDILYCEENGRQIVLNTKQLSIPHKELFNRSFVLDPLAYLNSNLIINDKSVIDESRKSRYHQPCIMAIVNITNNSFSGDGLLDRQRIESKIINLVNEAIPIIDIGCEATNVKAEILSAEEEIDKLNKFGIFDIIKDVRSKTRSTKFSIDTYHYETARICVENGFDIINDVNGFKSEEMWQIMANNPEVDAIIMHSLTTHTNTRIVVDDNVDIISLLNDWCADVSNNVERHNVARSRVVVDYGIGFNKTAWQSLKILKNLDKIDSHTYRVLIGHSRKSFMSLFTPEGTMARDRTLETLGCSIALQQKGVDILRVHDAIELKRVMNGYYNVLQL